MTEVQMVIRTMSGDVVEGDWEATDIPPDNGHAGIAASLGRPAEVIGIPTNGSVTFVRAAAIEWLRLNTR